MMRILNKIRVTDVAGIGTLAIIIGISVYWVSLSSEIYQEKQHLLYTAFAAYLVCFILVTREKMLLSLPNTYVALVIQLFSAFWIMANFPIEFLPILTIIWISIIPHYFSLRFSIITMLLVIALWFGLYQYIWQKRMFFSAMLYGTFHFFAILMTHQTKQAENATTEAQRLNKELMATQQLLAEATKQNERTRIARDLHDLLGHHLTALIINLQVAGHLTKGEAKDKVTQCHSLAKLLLSDVREAVSTLREIEDLDFESLVNLIVDNLPKIKVHTSIKTTIPIENLEIAKALLSCIQEASTNCLKHSGANEFWITVRQENQTIYLELYDNGQANRKLVEGNGLTGMRERIRELQGSLDINLVQNALKIDIEVPLNKRTSEN